MREIKFRGWYNGPLCSVMLEPNFNGPVNEIFNDPDNEGRVIYMQYTGLKDKNGKEIYEGDILEYGLLVGKIIFESGAFQFEILKSEHSKLIGARDCLIDLSEDGFEIIGNIYENPELLEVAG